MRLPEVLNDGMDDDILLFNEINNFNAKKSFNAIDVDAITSHDNNNNNNNGNGNGNNGGNRFSSQENNRSNSMGHNGDARIKSFQQILDPLYHRMNRKLTYQKSVVFRESSGSIIDIAVDDSSSPYFGVNCMVASTAYTDTQYNRPGELLSISIENDEFNPIQCMVMNGHYYTASGAGQVRGDRATTTCITYNKSSRLFFSGGYDGSVAIWDPTFSNPRARIFNGNGNNHINVIASHPKMNMGIFGTSTGHVGGFRFKNQKINKEVTVTTLLTKPPSGGKK